MKELEFSSNPFSTINNARRIHHMDRHHILPRANRGESCLTRGDALRLLNRSRADLRLIAYAKRKQQLESRLTVHIESHVGGIECGVSITEYDHREPDQVDFEITTLRGDSLPRLHKAMSIFDRVRIAEQCIAFANRERREEQDEAMIAHFETHRSA